MVSIGKLGWFPKSVHLGKCVCGQYIWADESGAVLHGIPPCNHFIAMEPADFLTYVRRSRGIPDPPEDETDTQEQR